MGPHPPRTCGCLALGCTLRLGPLLEGAIQLGHCIRLGLGKRYPLQGGGRGGAGRKGRQGGCMGRILARRLSNTRRKEEGLCAFSRRICCPGLLTPLGATRHLPAACSAASAGPGASEDDHHHRLPPPWGRNVPPIFTHERLVEQRKALHELNRPLGILCPLKHHPGLPAQAVGAARHDIHDGPKLPKNAAHGLLEVCRRWGKGGEGRGTRGAGWEGIQRGGRQQGSELGGSNRA